MKRRRFIVAVILVLGVAWLGYKVLSPHEPEYGGIKLSRWFVMYYRNMGRDQSKATEALAAIRAMGTNAVPFLLKQSFSRERDSLAWSNVLGFVEKMDLPFNVPRYIPVEDIRGAAVVAIEGIGPPAALILPAATNGLASTNRLDRLVGTYLLGTIADHRELATPWLIQSLQSSQFEQVALTLHSIGRLGEPVRGVFPEMMRAFTNPAAAPFLIWYACPAFASLGSNAAPAIPALKQRFLESTNYILRTNIAATVSRVDPKESGPLLEVVDEMMKTNTASARVELARFLGGLGRGASNVAPVLLPMLTDSRIEVACAAADALRRLGADRAQVSGRLKGPLADPDEAARFNAAKTLAAFEPANAEAINALVGLIQNGSVRGMAAMNELGQMGPAARSALPALREAARSNDRYVRGAAQSAITLIEAAP